MAIPNGAGGYQVGDGNLAEPVMGYAPAPATATASATLSTDQIFSQIILGSPSTTAVTYTLPTAASVDVVLSSAKPGSTFDFSITNVNGSGAGVITVAPGAGWSIVGLATVAATAGTSGIFRARKSGDGAWVLYRRA